MHSLHGKTARILSLLLVLVLTLTIMASARGGSAYAASAATKATADAAGYPTFSDGTAFVELGISANNEIILENETMTVTFPNDKSAVEGEDLVATTHAEYELYNSDALTAYAAVAVVKVLKVEKVNLTAEEAAAFESGERIWAGDSLVNGLIYDVDTLEHIERDSAYQTQAEAMANLEYSAYLDEAFTKYGITSLSEHERATITTGKSVLETQPADYWKVSENGEERLCIVVYNIEVPAMDSLILKVDNEVAGVMNRPTSYVTDGTNYTFYFTGSTLGSFFGVADEAYEFNLPDNEALGFISSDAPYYLNNNVYNARFKGEFSAFEFKIGTELTKEQIQEILAEHGSMKKIIKIIDIVCVILLIPAIAYIVVEIRKRRASGIGMDKNTYF